MADELGLHKISNPDEHRLAVSLHCRFFMLTLFSGVLLDWRVCSTRARTASGIGALQAETWKPSEGRGPDTMHILLILGFLVYTPPNAARLGCNVFCEKTGRRNHVTQSNFYSVFGRKIGN